MTLSFYLTTNRSAFKSVWYVISGVSWWISTESLTCMNIIQLICHFKSPSTESQRFNRGNVINECIYSFFSLLYLAAYTRSYRRFRESSCGLYISSDYSRKILYVQKPKFILITGNNWWLIQVYDKMTLSARGGCFYDKL